MKRIALLALTLSTVVPSPAAAQVWIGRTWISVSGGIQTAAGSDFTDSFTITRNLEDGPVEVRYPLKSRPLIAASAGVQFWHALGVGVGVTSISGRGNADVSAGIPHPFFFNTLRQISGTVSSRRNETGIHAQLAYLVPIGRRLRLRLTGGPSYIRLRQDVVADVQFSEAFPFDTATFTGAPTTRVSKGAVGFNAGADVAWMFARNVGVGALVQYSRATIDLTTGGRTISADAGGVAAGAGVRFAF